MLKMRRTARLVASTAAALAIGSAASPAYGAGDPTAADAQYGGVLGEQSGTGQVQGGGTLPFTGVNLVLLVGVGTGLTAAGVATRRLTRSV